MQAGGGALERQGGCVRASCSSYSSSAILGHHRCGPAMLAGSAIISFAVHFMGRSAGSTRNTGLLSNTFLPAYIAFHMLAPLPVSPNCL
jgi:hypothetical protein